MRIAEALAAVTESKITTGESLASDGLSLRLPNRSRLAQDRAGDSLMITGASGVGKSTMLLALAGIWPYFEGTITRPSSGKIFFLPQIPYIPIGTLREALHYPESSFTFKDGDIKDILELCGLERLIPKIDETERWSQILSSGEQQRIGWARAFLHKPDYLLLDEAISALDEAMQHKMYTSVRKMIPGITLISVAHRSELKVFHDGHLDLSTSDDFVSIGKAS